MRFKTAFVSLFAATAMLSSAYAADSKLIVQDVSGKVLLQTKSGFATVSDGQAVSAGSRIFVGQEASARITNTDGSCDALLPAGKTTVVDPDAICVETGAVITPAAYEGVPGEIPPPVVIGFFVAVLATGLIVAVTDDDDPVSAP